MAIYAARKRKKRDDDDEEEEGEGGEEGVIAAGGGGAVSNARRRMRRGGSENPLRAKIDGAAQPRRRNNFNFDFGANNTQPLCVVSGQAVTCEKSSERRKGEGRCQRGEDEQR